MKRIIYKIISKLNNLIAMSDNERLHTRTSVRRKMFGSMTECYLEIK